MHKIKEMLINQLYELEEKAAKMPSGKINANDLEIIHKLTDTVKNIDKIEMLEDGGHSEDGGMWTARGNYGGGMSYNEGGSSYTRGRMRAKRNSMGRYSRDAGRGGNYGGYSRDDGREHMMEQLEGMMEETSTEKEREAIRRCMAQLENA